MARDASRAAGLGSETAKYMLTSPELQDALTFQVLPLLPLRAIAALTCTCKDFRNLIYQQDPLWRAAAENHMPARHPSLPEDRAAIQALMQRRAGAKAKLFNGSSGTILPLGSFDESVDSILYSPCGQRIAVITQESQCISVYGAPEAALLWTTPVDSMLEDYQDIYHHPGYFCQQLAWNFGQHAISCFSISFASLTTPSGPQPIVGYFHMLQLDPRNGPGTCGPGLVAR
ncbi:hypothetical protein WJX73_008561 [Symbiochloris irregularis]|uniref:F-box domain-containing protein n=1 Tax=Symbiochloris irregularis TaxID=706552 RepID=A0AAW1NYP0_9CHLO